MVWPISADFVHLSRRLVFSPPKGSESDHVARAALGGSEPSGPRAAPDQEHRRRGSFDEREPERPDALLAPAIREPDHEEAAARPRRRAVDPGLDD